MTTIDWNDPDFFRNYQYRNGTKILAVHTLPHPFFSLTGYRYYTTDGEKACRHNADGSVVSRIESGMDVVPIPREPRTIEGWIKPDVFDVTDLQSFGVLAYQPQFPGEWVKIKITEVME